MRLAEAIANARANAVSSGGGANATAIAEAVRRSTGSNFKWLLRAWYKHLLFYGRHSQLAEPFRFRQAHSTCLTGIAFVSKLEASSTGPIHTSCSGLTCLMV